MTKEELYELLDIESAEDFKYVENVAQYLECEDEIDFGVLAALINELDKDETAGLFDDYFEEIMEFIPEAETEIYGLFTNIRRSLTPRSWSASDAGIPWTAKYTSQTRTP